MDEYEESWFDSEDDELDNLTETPSLMTTETMTPVTTTVPTTSATMGCDQLATKSPPEVKLKDVDLLDSLSVKSKDSPPASIVTNRASSPNGLHTNWRSDARKPGSPNSLTRPLSPVNNVFKPLSPQQQQQQTQHLPQQDSTNKIFINSKQLGLVNNHLAKNNNKQIQIKINSVSNNLVNKTEGDRPTTNGVTTTSPANNARSSNATTLGLKHQNYEVGKNEQVMVRKPVCFLFFGFILQVQILQTLKIA